MSGFIEGAGASHVKPIEHSLRITEFITVVDVYKRQVPDWMDVDIENLKGTVKELPLREAIDVPVDEMLIVELYSK